ncbi:MAG: tRNA uracil 4-sulfurtransferase ThiI, partial [Candidatus Njordarchaeia archaeon]
VALIRYSGEIPIKSYPVRTRLENLVQKDIKFFLKKGKIEFEEIRKSSGRLFVYSENPKEVCDIVRKIFGVASCSPAVEVPNDIEAIKATLISYFKDKLKAKETFAIRARRLKIYPINSKEIENILGDVVLKSYPNLKVDLTNPQLEIFVEVREKNAYLFTDIIKGVGGLPYGFSGRIVVLFSGGTDSTLAAWYLMKRGADIIPVYMDMNEFWSNRAHNRVVNALTWIREWIPIESKYYYIVPIWKIHSSIKLFDEKFRCLFCKALMYRIAEIIAKNENARGIATGESMAQVASQTLDNLYFLSSLIEIPIYRPLIGFDKQEILDKAREIGLYEISSIDVGKCKLVPKHPATYISEANASKLRAILDEIDFDLVLSTIKRKTF